MVEDATDVSDLREVVHVTFGQSIADTITKFRGSLGSSERAIGLPTTLSVGPIDPPDPYLRQPWARSALLAGTNPLNQLDGDPVEVEHSWAEATRVGILPVYWVCLSSPMEHAFVMAFVTRMHGRQFDIVDATDLDFTTVGGVKGPSSLGMMRVQDILASDLYGMRRRYSSEEQYTAAKTWSALCRENAPFRIVRDGQLVSAPLTQYDDFLTEQASEDWEIAAQLIGRVLNKLSFENSPPGHGTSDTVLFGRMLALGDDGALKIIGSGPSIRDYRVRRAVA